MDKVFIDLIKWIAMNINMEFIKDVSIVVGLWYTFYQINAWQREHKGKKNIDLAEETLALFYEAKDVVAWMRSPLGFSGETDSIERRQNETDEKFEARKNASVIFVRYNDNKELFNKIQSMKYRFMAQLGKDKVKPFDDLNSVIKEIITSAHILAMLWPERSFSSAEDERQHNERIKKAQKIFWDTFEENDPIKTKIDTIVSNMEKICEDVNE